MYYDYECNQCGVFEVKQSIKDEPLTVCPKCGDKVNQVYSVPVQLWKGGFRFKTGNPEVDMDKIDAEQNARALKQAKAKVHTGLAFKKGKRFY